MVTTNGLRFMSAPLQEGSALTIGNFDGLHLGHRALVKEVIAEAQYHRWSSALLTFDPHPVQFLLPQIGFKRLFPLSDLQKGVDCLGINHFIMEPFTQKIAIMDPGKFWIEKVAPCLRPRLLVVGHDFNFGAGRKGNLEFLQKLAVQEGFELRTIAPIQEGGHVVSSSRIRELICQGKVEEAQLLLDRPFSVRGVVCRGDQKGHQLGFPTANIEGVETLMPAPGVYITQTLVPGDKLVSSVTNVGFAPSLRATGSGLRLESHLLEEGNWELYNKEIEILFFTCLRLEMKFSGVEQLKQQIARDVMEAQEYWLKRQQNSGQKFP